MLLVGHDSVFLSVLSQTTFACRASITLSWKRHKLLSGQEDRPTRKRQSEVWSFVTHMLMHSDTNSIIVEELTE